MLTSSFCCFAGIGLAAERRFYQAGLLSWDDLGRPARLPLSPAKHQTILNALPQARLALQAGLADYFLQRLPPAATPRLYPDFADSLACLDIETTGLAPADPITTAALYHRGRLHLFVAGINLDQLLLHLPAIRLLITFNGTCFDLPRLRRHFRCDFAQPHLDLLPALHAAGWHGSQKSIAARLRLPGLAPPAMAGQDAPALWQAYHEHGDRDSLRRLLHYNAIDAITLLQLLHEACRQSMATHPLAHPLARPLLVDPAEAVAAFFDN